MQSKTIQIRRQLGTEIQVLLDNLLMHLNIYCQLLKFKCFIGSLDHSDTRVAMRYPQLFFGTKHPDAKMYERR